MQVILRPTTVQRPLVIDPTAGDVASRAKVHYRADTLTGVGSPQARWGNLADSRNHALAPTNDDRPTLVTSGGQPAVRFDGTDQLTVGPGLGFPETYQIFAVATAAEVSVEGGLFGSTVVGASGDRRAWGAVGMGYDGSDPSTLVDSLTAGDPLITTADQRFLVSLSYDGAQSSLSFNDGAPTVVAEAPMPRNISPSFFLGSWGPGSIAPWNGDVFEFLLFDGLLSAREAQTLTADLKSRYSIA